MPDDNHLEIDSAAPVAPEKPGHRPNVGLASAIMTGSLLLSRVLGILRETAMSHQFKVGSETDAYRLAFALPDTIFYLIAGGALSSAFIPVFSSLLHTDREDDAWELFNVIVTVMAIAVTILIGIAWILAPESTAYFAHGKDPHLFPLITKMTRIILPAQFAFFIGGLLFGTLYARQRFALPGLAPNIYNFGIIIGAVVISHFVAPGIIGMAWGALVGAIVGSLLLPLWSVYRLGGRYRPSLNVKAEGVKQVFALMLPVILGLSLPAVYGLIMQKLASQYQDGINTSVDLANKLMQAPLGVFGQSLALAAFPALSQFFAQKRMDMFRDQLASSLRTVSYLSLPASALIAALAPQIVHLAFLGGHTTDPKTLDPVISCLQLFCIGIFAWCMHPMLMRSFYAMHKTVAPIVIGTITTGIFVGLYFALVHLFPAGQGYLAMPLSGSIAAILMVCALGALAYKEVGGFQVGSVLTTLLKSAIAATVAGGVAAGLFQVMPHISSKWVLFVAFTVVALCGAWIYYFITKALKMPETAYVSRAIDKFKRKMGGPPPTL